MGLQSEELIGAYSVDSSDLKVDRSKYKIIMATTIDRLQSEIEYYLFNGWSLSGGISVQGNFWETQSFYQAIFKEEK